MVQEQKRDPLTQAPLLSAQKLSNFPNGGYNGISLPPKKHAEADNNVQTDPYEKHTQSLSNGPLPIVFLKSSLGLAYHK